jgi:outer membrane receptor protein involved in Fe transport
LGLEWDVTPSWRTTAAATYSYSRTHRFNFWPATATVPVLDNEVIAKQDLLTLTLGAEGPLFRMPGGSARLAIGAEHRREGLEVIRLRGSPSLPLTSRNIDAAYAELLLPLVGRDNAGAFGQRLDLTGAFRFEHYNDLGSTENVRLGAIWEPLTGVRLRGTYGTSFRAPLLINFDTTLGNAITFDVPTPTGPVPTLFIGNYPASDLGPETATTWSAGFDVAPPRLAGFSVNFTYYDIDYRNRITASPSAFTLFVDPLLQPLVSIPPDPELIALAPTLPFFVPFSAVPLDMLQASFDGRTRNQARTRMRGIDLLINHRFRVGSGNLSTSLNASYIIDLVYQQVEGVPGISVVDTIFNPTDLKVRGQVGWSNSNFSITGAVNYLDSYADNQLPTAVVEVGSMTTLDLTASYRFTTGLLNGLTLRAAVTNLFNEYPPFIIDRRSSFGNPGFDTQNHSPLGRVIAFEVVKSW